MFTTNIVQTEPKAQIIIQADRAPTEKDLVWVLDLKIVSGVDKTKKNNFFPGQEWFDTKNKKRYVFMGVKKGKAEWKLTEASFSDEPSAHIVDPTDLPTCISAVTSILRAMEKAGLLSES